MTLSWQPSAGATAYELLVRRTTSPTWEQIIPLGNVTSCSLKRQLDDEWAGVRAVGVDGSRSMAASMPAPNTPRPADQVAAPPSDGRGGPPAPPPPLCGSGA